MQCVCVLRVQLSLYNEGHEITEYAESIGNMLKHCVSLEDGGLVQVCCIRIVHELALSPRCVDSLSRTPILQLLLSLHLPGTLAVHYDGAFILEAIFE